MSFQDNAALEFANGLLSEGINGSRLPYINVGVAMEVATDQLVRDYLTALVEAAYGNQLSISFTDTTYTVTSLTDQAFTDTYDVARHAYMYSRYLESFDSYDKASPLERNQIITAQIRLICPSMLEELREKLPAFVQADRSSLWIDNDLQSFSDEYATSGTFNDGAVHFLNCAIKAMAANILLVGPGADTSEQQYGTATKSPIPPSQWRASS